MMLDSRARLVAFGLVGFVLAGSAEPAGDPADVILTGGPVITLDEADRVAGAIAVRGRHIRLTNPREWRAKG